MKYVGQLFIDLYSGSPDHASSGSQRVSMNSNDT